MGACSSHAEDEWRKLQQQQIFLLTQLTSNLSSNNNNSIGSSSHYALQHASASATLPTTLCQHCQHIMSHIATSNSNLALAAGNNSNNNYVHFKNNNVVGGHHPTQEDVCGGQDSIVFKIIAMNDNEKDTTPDEQTNDEEDNPNRRLIKSRSSKSPSRHKNFMIKIGNEQGLASGSTIKIPLSQLNSQVKPRMSKNFQIPRKEINTANANTNFNNTKNNNNNKSEETKRKTIKHANKVTSCKNNKATTSNKNSTMTMNHQNIDELISKQSVYDNYINNIDMFNNNEDRYCEMTTNKPNLSMAVVSKDDSHTREKLRHAAELNKKQRPRPFIEDIITAPIETDEKEDDDLDLIISNEYEYDYEYLNDEFDDKSLLMYTSRQHDNRMMISQKKNKSAQRERGAATTQGKAFYEIAIDLEKRYSPTKHKATPISPLSTDYSKVNRANAKIASEKLVSFKEEKIINLNCERDIGFLQGIYMFYFYVSFLSFCQIKIHKVFRYFMQ